MQVNAQAAVTDDQMTVAEKRIHTCENL